MAHLDWVTQDQISSGTSPTGATPTLGVGFPPCTKTNAALFQRHSQQGKQTGQIFLGLGRSWTPPSFSSSWNAASPLSAGTSPPPSFLSGGIPPPLRAASMRAPKKTHMRAARATDRKHALRSLARRSRSLGFGRSGVQFPAAGPLSGGAREVNKSKVRQGRNWHQNAHRSLPRPSLFFPPPGTPPLRIAGPRAASPIMHAISTAR